MKNFYRRVKRAIRRWWECRTQRCTYYEHYLVYGPAELTHVGWHKAEEKGSAHFQNCSYRGDRICPTCSIWERRLRA